MERLTFKQSIDGYTDVGLREGVTVGDAICQLAEYEATGLTPEEIAVLMNPAPQKVIDAIAEAIPQIVQLIVENVPKLLENCQAETELQYDLPAMDDFMRPMAGNVIERR